MSFEKLTSILSGQLGDSSRQGGSTMENLVYYPTFEVSRIDWLKFALLYIDSLQPIIPESADGELSDLFNRIHDETDLLNIHRPDLDEGMMASLDAMEYVERIIHPPLAYAAKGQHRFGRHNEVPGFVLEWSQPARQNFILFGEKYTADFEHYCLVNHFATRCEQGLRMHDQLAGAYMTFLAQAIGDSQGVSTITDVPDLNRLFLGMRKANALGANTGTQNRVAFAKAVISLKIPANLSEVPIDRILKLRNNNSFRNSQKEFQRQVRLSLSGLEEGQSPDTFIRSLEHASDEFMPRILALASSSASVAMSVWLPRNDAVSPILTALAPCLSVAASIVYLRTSWTHTKPQRMARRYLADISKLA
jgi:hypothetical protein